MTLHAFQRPLDLGDRPKAGFAQLTNMSLGLRTYLDCEEAEPGEPRIGLLHGPSGYGKSVAMAFTAQRTGAANTPPTGAAARSKPLRAGP